MKAALAVALVTLAAYVLLLLPMAALGGFDLSLFVIAGDRFVNVAHLPAFIIVRQGSDGYDGQFFYRFALNPWSAAPAAFGISLDNPAQRMTRILYPALAWLLSLGRAPLVPAALLAINLAGIATIGGCAAWLARRRGLAWWLPFAVVVWPGFLVTLTRDTAEIVAAACLLLALAGYLSDRLLAYCAFAAAAALARETTLPVLFGIFLAEVYARRPSRIVLSALAMVPLGIWRVVVSVLWHQSPLSTGNNVDMGWPLLGIARMLLENFSGARSWDPDPAADLFARAFVLTTSLALVAFCVVCVWLVPRRLRTPGPSRGIALGWVLLAVLMSLLTSEGPWIEPPAYLRAFTDFYVVGCVLLALAPEGRAADRLAVLAAALAAAEVTFVNWQWCLGALR